MTCTPKDERALATALPRGRAGGENGAFARALDAEGVQRRRGILGYHRLDVGYVLAGGQQVVHQRAGQQLPSGIVDQLLQHRAADALRRAAHRLPVHRQRVDAAAHVLHHHIAQHFHLARLSVHGDMGRVAAVGVGPLLDAEILGSVQRSVRVVELPLRLGQSGHLPPQRQGDENKRATTPRLPVAESSRTLRCRP